MRDLKNIKIAFRPTFFAAVSFFAALVGTALAHTGGGPNAGIPLVPGPGPLRLCDLWHLADHIINFSLFVLATPILIIMLLAGGIIWLTSAGNPNQIGRGKKLIVSAIIGVLIAFSGWLIIGTIINTLASEGFSGAWNAIECPAGPVAAERPAGEPPVTGLACSAKSVSAAVNSMVNCVINGAVGAGISVNPPSPNQLNGGSHTCNLNSDPPNISCHYGGTQCNGTGNAADFSLSSGRNSTNWEKLRSLAVSCGASGGAFCEAGGTRFSNCDPSSIDHVHANASASCGCK